MSSIEFSSTLMGSARDRRPEKLRCPIDAVAGGFGCRVPGPFARLNYRLGQLIGRSIFSVTMNVYAVRPEAAEREGGYVLACTHFGHLDPVCLGTLIRRKIDWMARLEFFRYRLSAAYLWSTDAFPVNRFGVCARAIRTAIARAAGGRVIGIFPEGGVVSGLASACRGGPIKKGACVVAQRAGVPIIPCVILGTHLLNQPVPWIPYRRGSIWVIFGEPVEPRPDLHRRAARHAMAAELQAAFEALYGEVRAKYGIADGEIP